MFMQEIKAIHIGTIIREELKIQNQTVSWLARQLRTNRMAVYRIFESPSIDTSLLLRLSLILNTDFFAIYSTRYHQITSETTTPDNQV